jgi:hypothetical protein
MKALYRFIALLVLVVSGQAVRAQVGNPPLQRINSIGFEWNAGQFDRLLNVPHGRMSDTLTFGAIYAALTQAGACFYDTVNHVNYRYYNGHWNPESGGGGGTQVQSDWTMADPSNLSYIKNKPPLAAVAISGTYADLIGRPDLTLYVPKTRTITINGVAQDLSVDRSWTVSGGGTGGGQLVNIGSGLHIAAPASNGLKGIVLDPTLLGDSTTAANSLYLTVNKDSFYTKSQIDGRKDSIPVQNLGTQGDSLTYVANGLLKVRRVKFDAMFPTSRLSDSVLNVTGDTANVFVSKAYFAAHNTGGAGGSYTAGWGTRFNGATISTDTMFIYLPNVGPIKLNDSTFDNSPTIAAGMALASATGKMLIGPGNGPNAVMWCKGQISPKSYVDFEYFNVKFNFTSSRAGMTNTDYATTVLYNFRARHFVLDRSGPNTDHGIIISNAINPIFEDFYINDNDATAAGGAIGFSAFNAQAGYPCYDVIVNNGHFTGAGNFCEQFGNCFGVSFNGIWAYRCYREIVGVEPYGLSGISGRVEHVFGQNIFINTPDGTVQNGSNTGSVIVTQTSLGTLKDIRLQNIHVKGGTQNSMHAVACYHIQDDVYIDGVYADSVGGYGVYATSGTGGASMKVHFSNIHVNVAGRDGSHTAGAAFNDCSQCTLGGQNEVTNTLTGLYEFGTSELGDYENLNCLGCTTAYIAAQGRPHSSKFINIYGDSSNNYNIRAGTMSLGTAMIPTGNSATDSVLALRPTSNGMSQMVRLPITAAGGLNPSDTSAYNLEQVMHNSSVLGSGHTIYHLGYNYQFFGGPYNPVKFANGIQISNQGLYSTTQSNLKGSLQWVDSVGTGTTEHLWFRGNRSIPYDLLAGGTGAGRYFNGYRYVDSTINGQAVHVGMQFRYSDGTYTDTTRFTFVSPGGSGGGANQTLQQVLNNGNTLTGSNIIYTGSVLSLVGDVALSNAIISNLTLNPESNAVNGNGDVVADYTLNFSYCTLTVDASANNIIITAPSAGGHASNPFWFIKRVDASSHSVTVVSATGKIDRVTQTVAIGSRGGMVLSVDIFGANIMAVK